MDIKNIQRHGKAFNDAKVAIFNINRSYVPNDPQKSDIKASVQGDWVVSDSNAGQIKYIFAEYKSTIIGVFEINGDPIKIKNRYRFDINDISSDTNASILIGLNTHRVQGEANPVRIY